MKEGPFSFDAATVLKALSDNVADSIYLKDTQCRIMWANRKMALDLGLQDPSELIGKTDQELFGEEFGQRTSIDDTGVMETGRPILGLVESRTRDNGEINWTSTTKLPLYNEKGEVFGLLGITREINERIRAEQDLQHQATHDNLTGLANRFLFLDTLENAVHRAKRRNAMVAVLFVDLDGFKLVNDRWGHATGDEVLKQIAERLKSSVREVDIVARLGGDEFTIILEDLTNQDDAMKVAEKLRKQIERPLQGKAFETKLSASIGISLYPQHSENSWTLLRAADHAMYRAKQVGNSCAFYSPPPSATT